MYLFPLELSPLKEGFVEDAANQTGDKWKESGCITVVEVAQNNTDVPPMDTSGVSGVGMSPDDLKKAEEGSSAAAAAAPLAIVCTNKAGDLFLKSIEDILELIQAQLNEFTDLLSRFDPLPKELTLQGEIQKAQDILDTALAEFKTGEKNSYEMVKVALTQVQDLVLSIEKEMRKFLDMLKNPLSGIPTEQLEQLLSSIHKDTQNLIRDAQELAKQERARIEDELQKRIDEIRAAADEQIRKAAALGRDISDQVITDTEREVIKLREGALRDGSAVTTNLQSTLASIEGQSKEYLDKATSDFELNASAGSSFFSSAAQETDAQMSALADNAFKDGLKITDEINKMLSRFKMDGGIRVDLLEEYDRLYQGTGIAEQNAEIQRQKEVAKAALLKSTAETANLIQAAQNPGFFMSILESIIYIDPTSNPNFVYKTEKPPNPALEQARQIVYYIAYAVIVVSILMFLSTKTFVMPFFQTFIFWFKRYFVFLAWILVVGLIYVFMTNWFTWIIREDIRYMAFVVNPLLHPSIHEIWHSKYKYWIKLLVYGLASMAFFISALFFTAVVLFLIAPLFLLLLWASGQLMSYFEKEELDEE